MLELLNSGRLVYPTPPGFTGPGPQEIIGRNDTAGFYGETSVEELISGDALATMIGLTAGTAQNSNSPWLKFFLDDQILFVAKQPFRHTVSWNQINAANAVSGDRVIEIGGLEYRISLLEGIGKDHSVIGTGADHPLSHGSEWNRLMYNVALPLGTTADIRDSQVGDQWANYPQTAVADGLWLSAGNGNYSWCKEPWPTSASYRVTRGSNSVSRLSSIASSTASSGTGWRPCLRLVSDRYPLYPPEDLFYLTNYVKNPRITAHYYQD